MNPIFKILNNANDCKDTQKKEKTITSIYIQVIFILFTLLCSF